MLKLMHLAHWRIAFRELTGNLARFRIYLACLGVGAFAIAASGSVIESFRDGVNAEARQLLGGDVAFTLTQRIATPEERALIDGLGTIAETARLRLMASSEKDRKQVRLRAVDGAFPLLGTVRVEGAPYGDALHKEDDHWGVIVSQSLLDDFGLAIGDRLDIGQIPVRITGRLVAEPDSLGEPGLFQPEAMIALDAVRENGLIDQGRLFRMTYLVTLDAPRNLDMIEETIRQTMGEDAIRLRRPADAVDGLADLLDLLGSFLAVIGVAALIAGGVGIAQATAAFLDQRIASIATLKSFGARTNDIRVIYGLQLIGLAILGSGIGIVLGAATPFVLNMVAAGRIPLPQTPALYPLPLGLALIMGLLTAIAFCAPALGRACTTPPAALFRLKTETKSAGQSGKKRRLRVSPEWCLSLLAALLLVVIATVSSPRPLAALALLAGSAACYALLAGVAYLLRWRARRHARHARGFARLLWSNLGGPGSITPLLAPALGIGLAVLALVAGVRSNLLRQIGETAPQNAPSLVFSQIGADDAPGFDATLRAAGVEIDDPDLYRRVPLVLVRLMEIGSIPINEADIAESERWVTGREIQAAYLAKKPPEAALTAGQWWPDTYDGALLVSVEAGVARGLRLAIGDTLGYRVSGRDIRATIAAIHEVDWGGFGVNQAFIFSPGPLAAANPRHYAIAKVPPDTETQITRAVGAAYPDVLVFRTREILETARKVVGDISIAVNAIASVVMIAGLLVLIGALMLIVRQRRRESAILRVYGASRQKLLSLYAGEFAITGLIAAVIGVGLALAATYPIVVFIFEATWSVPLIAVGLVVAGAVAACLGAGLIAGKLLLDQKPAPVLRSD